MIKGLNINNPTTDTYGVLSPDYNKDIKIGKSNTIWSNEQPIILPEEYSVPEVWKNVIIYTYGKYFDDYSGIKNLIKNSKTKDVPAIFSENEYRMDLRQIKESVFKAYEAKKDDPEFVSVLLSTGDKKLVFDRFEIDPNYVYDGSSINTYYPVTPDGYDSEGKAFWKDGPMISPTLSLSSMNSSKSVGSDGSPYYVGSPVYKLENKKYKTKNFGIIDYETRTDIDGKSTRITVSKIDNKRLKNFVGLPENKFIDNVDNIDKYVTVNPKIKNIKLQVITEINKLNKSIKDEKTNSVNPESYLLGLTDKLSILEKDLKMYEELPDDEIPLPSLNIENTEITLETTTLSPTNYKNYVFPPEEKEDVSGNIKYLNVIEEINHIFPSVLEIIRSRIKEGDKESIINRAIDIYSHLTYLIQSGQDNLEEWLNLSYETINSKVPVSDRIVKINDCPSELLDYTIRTLDLSCMVKFLRKKYILEYRNKYKNLLEEKILREYLYEEADKLGFKYSEFSGPDKKRFEKIKLLELIGEGPKDPLPFTPEVVIISDSLSSVDPKLSIMPPEIKSSIGMYNSTYKQPTLKFNPIKAPEPEFYNESKEEVDNILNKMMERLNKLKMQKVVIERKMNNKGYNKKLNGRTDNRRLFKIDKQITKIENDMFDYENNAENYSYDSLFLQQIQEIEFKRNNLEIKKQKLIDTLDSLEGERLERRKERIQKIETSIKELEKRIEVAQNRNNIRIDRMSLPLEITKDPEDSGDFYSMTSGECDHKNKRKCCIDNCEKPDYKVVTIWIEDENCSKHFCMNCANDLQLE